MQCKIRKSKNTCQIQRSIQMSKSSIVTRFLYQDIKVLALVANYQSHWVIQLNSFMFVEQKRGTSCSDFLLKLNSVFPKIWSNLDVGLSVLHLQKILYTLINVHLFLLFAYPVLVRFCYYCLHDIYPSLACFWLYGLLFLHFLFIYRKCHDGRSLNHITLWVC